MKKNVMLSIRGRQFYEEQEPEVIELVTEGVMERRGEEWLLTYEESELTGLKGVTTTFSILPGRVVLTRTGALASQMVFQEGVFHDSLYETEFGLSMQITVCAQKVACRLTENGGTVDLNYAIEIEQTAAGFIEYHLDIQ